MPKRLFGVLCGKGVTTHTIRNLGYVLAIWGDGEMLEAVRPVYYRAFGLI